MDSKSDLRKKAKCIRKSLSIAEKSTITNKAIRKKEEEREHQKH